MLKNFFNLTLVQVVNQLIPLLVIPIVLRRIGLEAFAVVAFVQSLATVMSGLADYGFVYSATRRVSVHRNDNSMLMQILSEVMSARFLLFLLTLPVIGLVFILLPVQTGGILMFVGAALWVMGSVLWPQWFFVGTERMHWITLINAITKLLFFVAAVALIRLPSDAWLLIALFGLSNVMAALASMLLIRWQWGIALRPASVSAIAQQLRQGWPLFVSTASTTSLVNSNVLILGLFVQGSPLGWFGLAEKVLLALQQLLATFSQATYPALCRVVGQLTDKSHRLRSFFSKNYLWFFVLFILITGIVFILAPLIVQLLSGEMSDMGTKMLRLLLPVPVLVLFNIIPSQLLLANNRDNAFRTAYLTAAMANLAFNLSLAPWLGTTGTALAMTLTHLTLNILLWKFTLHPPSPHP